MKLTFKNDELYAVENDGSFIGKIVNRTYCVEGISGYCVENPEYENPGTFERCYSEHGYIYHQSDNPPNPFFVKSWSQVFDNPELLPNGTKNVFIDCSQDAFDDFNSRLVGAIS